MTYASQTGSRDGLEPSTAASVWVRGRRLPLVVGLAAGAVVSLVLWAGLALLTLRLFG